MEDRQKRIEDELRGMDLAQLRVRYHETFGQESRSGAEYLRRKIAYALLTQPEATESDEESYVHEGVEMDRAPYVINGATEVALEQPPPHEKLAAFGQEALDQGDPEGANGFFLRAAACAPAPEAKRLREAAEAAAAQVARKDLGAPSFAELAQQAEARGDVAEAIRMWGMLAHVVPDRREEAGRRIAQLEDFRAQEATPAPDLDSVLEPEDPAAALPVKADEHPSEVREVFQPEAEQAQDVAPLVEQALAAVTTASPPTSESVPAPSRALKPRDQRLPPQGFEGAFTVRTADKNQRTLRLGFGDASSVRVVWASATDEAGPPLVGKFFDSISGLARAYTGKNTNGYNWCGLDKPWTDTAAAASSSFTFGDEAASDNPQPAAAVPGWTGLEQEAMTEVADELAKRRTRPTIDRFDIEAMTSHAHELIDAARARASTFAPTPSSAMVALSLQSVVAEYLRNAHAEVSIALELFMREQATPR